MTAPTIVITLPAEGYEYHAPSSIDVSATATAGTNNLSHIIFGVKSSNGLRSFAAVDSSLTPAGVGSASWGSVSSADYYEGAYTIYAIVVDDKGFSAIASRTIYIYET